MGPEGDQPAWCYTVGVTEVTGHPELVMVGACPQCAAGTLNRLGSRIRSGERFEVPTRYPVFRGPDLAPIHLRPVHPDHWDTDRFTMWLWYYRQRGWHPPRREAVQVVVPDDAGRFPWEPEAAALAAIGHHRAPTPPRLATTRRRPLTSPRQSVGRVPAPPRGRPVARRRGTGADLGSGEPTPQGPDTNSVITEANSSGCERCGTWPAP